MNSTVKKAVGLGALAGLRTTIPPAVISHFKSRKENSGLSNSKLSFMQSSLASVVTKLLSTAEVTADKMPGTSKRIELSQTLPRIASGALVGALVFQAAKDNYIKGALIGGVSALAATYISFYTRKNLKKIPYVKDPVLGFLEDMFVLKSSKSLLGK